MYVRVAGWLVPAILLYHVCQLYYELSLLVLLTCLEGTLLQERGVSWVEGSVCRETIAQITTISSNRIIITNAWTVCIV